MPAPQPCRRARSGGFAAFAASVIALSIGATALATEEPTYQVVRTYPDFELRRYGPTLLAETRVNGDFEGVGNEAFRRLARFIFGDNEPKQKIEMTAPVSQRPAEPEASAVAAGVAPRGDYVLSFVMPGRFTADSLPRPQDPRIKIRSEPPRLMAARRYSGRWTWQNYRKNESALLASVRAAGLEPAGSPVYARYNAPFTPWFMRRNEVLVQVREPGGAEEAAGR
ncbi:MAG: SOUL family heme-binding protein [Anaerolineae bacterium]